MSTKNKMLISNTNSTRTVTAASATIAVTTTTTTTTTTPAIITTTSACSICHHIPPTSASISIKDIHTNSENVCKELHNTLLNILDMLFSSLLVAPCVIAYWRGAWELMNVYITPSNLALSAIISFLVGSVGHMFFTLMQHHLRKHVHPDKRRLTFYFVSRCYTAIFGLVCVNMWRGSWIICDILTSANSVVIVAIVTITSLFFMIATRTVRNLASPPFAVCVDNKYNYFDINTLFSVQGFRQPGLYVLDTIFSVFVVGSLIVLVWRGTWVLIDLTFLPQNPINSAWGSLMVGYALTFMCFASQPILRCVCQQINYGFIKLLLCDIYHILSFFGSVNCWRAIWNLLDIYLFSDIFADNKLLGYWVTSVIPFILLILLKCSNSVLVRGVYLDAEGPQGDSLDLQISVCKSHFEHERSKKEHLNKMHCNLSRDTELESQSMLTEKPIRIVDMSRK